MTPLQTTLADLSATLGTALASVHAGPRRPIVPVDQDVTDATQYHFEEMEAEYGTAARDPWFDEAKEDREEPVIDDDERD